MATYPGTMPAGPGIVTKPICFSAGTASAIGGALRALGAFLGATFGALAGLLIGLIVSLLAGPEGVPQAAGMAIGAVIGALLGSAAGYLFMKAQIAGGACACPPGSEAFCLNFYFQIIPGTTTVIPLPWPPTAAPAACTLVPAGCP